MPTLRRDWLERAMGSAPNERLEMEVMCVWRWGGLWRPFRVFGAREMRMDGRLSVEWIDDDGASSGRGFRKLGAMHC